MEGHIAITPVTVDQGHVDTKSSVGGSSRLIIREGVAVRGSGQQ